MKRIITIGFALIFILSQSVLTATFTSTAEAGSGKKEEIKNQHISQLAQKKKVTSVKTDKIEKKRGRSITLYENIVHNLIDIKQMVVALCGNGVVDKGEQCDDGNRRDGDWCNSTCRFECTDPTGATCAMPPRCGNGVVEIGEECDGSPGCFPAGHPHECRSPHPPPPATCDCEDPNDPECPTITAPPGSPNPSRHGVLEFCENGVDLPWTRIFGLPNEHEGGKGIEVDVNGTIYAISNENMRISDNRENGVMLRQIETCGNIIWERFIPSYVAAGDPIAIDPCGNSHIVVRNNNGIMVRKYDYYGSEVWSRYHSDPLDPPSFLEMGGIAVDGEGNVIMTSFLTVTPDEETDVLIKKYSVGGRELWRVISDSSTGREGGYAADVDAVGNIYIAGGMQTPPVAITNNDSKWLAKYSSSGGLLWSVVGDRYSSNAFTGIDASLDDIVYAVGGYTELFSPVDGSLLISDSDRAGGRSLIVNGDGTHFTVGAIGPCHLWIAKHNQIFEVLWEDIIDQSPGDDHPCNPQRFNDVATDPRGAVYVIGAESDPDPDVDGYLDNIIKKYTRAPDGVNLITDGWPSTPPLDP